MKRARAPHSPFPMLRQSMAACIGLVLSANVPGAVAAIVTDCGDAGPGTLRNALGGAAPEETIDVSACTEISLTSGELALPAGTGNYTIKGTGTLITASGASRVLAHAGSGWLFLEDVEIAGGAVAGVNAMGGCVASQGNISLSGVTVHDCIVTGVMEDGDDGRIRGGGVAAAGAMFMDKSVVRDSTLVGATGTYSSARGGGVYVGGRLSMSHSTISGNAVVGHARSDGAGGVVAQSTYIESSTISGNSAFIGGGLVVGGSSQLMNSTVSGNRAQSYAGGVRGSGEILISNCTIAFNEVAAPTAFSGGGINMTFGSSLNLHSSIIAQNTAGGMPDDMGGVHTFSGAANLIGVAGMPPPPDTISGSPMLGQLADNGGGVLTHALRAGSPAIDHGENGPSSWDERGKGYHRVVGANTDIGAFEVQEGELIDSIFEDNFD